LFTKTEESCIISNRLELLIKEHKVIFTAEQVEEIEKKYFILLCERIEKKIDEIFERAGKIRVLASDTDKKNKIENYFEREVLFLTSIYYNEVGFAPWNGAVSSDSSFSNYENVVIHIDAKTTENQKNKSDYINKEFGDILVVGSNQVSIETRSENGNTFSPLLDSITKDGYVVLTFFIHVFWEIVEEDKIVLSKPSLISIPNGMLKPNYPEKLITSFKTYGSTPSVRFKINYFKNPSFTNGWERKKIFKL